MDQLYADWIVSRVLVSVLWMSLRETPKLKKTVFEDIVEFDGYTHGSSTNMPTGYGVKKFLSSSLMPYGYATQSQHEWVVLRYAEVLLMFAEAQNVLSDPKVEVYETINKVRSRAGLPNVSQGLDKVRYARID